MARNMFQDHVHCLMCAEKVPDGRMKKRAVTCSEECAKERTKQLRRLADLKYCRYCNRPATPEQQASWRRWRAWERKHPPTEAEVQASTITPQEDNNGEAMESVN